MSVKFCSGTLFRLKHFFPRQAERKGSIRVDEPLA